MLNETDLKESRETLHIIAHVKDGATSKLTFIEILSIFEFVLLSIKAIMFTKEGKPKSKIQLMLSFPAIIRFIRDLVRRINKETREKRARRVEKGLSKGIMQYENDMGRGDNPEVSQEFLRDLASDKIEKAISGINPGEQIKLANKLKGKDG